MPVQFWIHGGAFVSGAGSLDWYNGKYFAHNEEIILVSINYRLGALGFLCHPEISGGNLGIQDQMLALEWVSQNIKSFGGDPDKITVMGQSAGAIFAFALLANNKTRHLIKNVIFQNGRYDSFERPEIAFKKAEKFAKIAGLRVKQLASMPLEDMLDTQSTLAQKEAAFAETKIPFLPVIDGDIIPIDTHAAALEGAIGKGVVPGTTQNEMHAFTSGQPEIEGASQKQIETVFRKEFKHDWESTLKYCQQKIPAAAPMELLSQGLNLAHFEGQTTALAINFAKKGIKTWLYRFDWKSNQSLLGACHCIELPFLFNTFEQWAPPMTSGLELNEGLGLSKALQKTWATFSRHRNPNHDGIPYWPKFSKTKQPEIHWNTQIEVMANLTHNPLMSSQKI